MTASGYWYEEIPPEERSYRLIYDREYRQAALRRLQRQVYRASDAGKAARKRERERYRQTENGKAAIKRQKERYQRNARWRSFNFVGVDGEGGGTTGHDYLLLRAGDNYLHTGKPLTSYECLSFLADLDPTNTYVGYFFDYDVTMILKHLPEERLRRIYANTKNNMSVEWHGFEMHYRPGKYFRVRRLGGKFVTISDVGSFFQCSFVKALKAWNIGSPEELELVIAGKNNRSNFTTMSAVELEYNRTEIVLLEQLMSKFAAACRAVDILPRAWQGPGELAAALLQREGIPVRSTLDNVPLDLWEHANSAYYGGRFELTRFGIVKPPIHNYDINSAYPDALRQLPCLVHGEWTVTVEPEPDALLSLSYGSYEPLPDHSHHALYGLPFRAGMDGTICWPKAGRGWYWSVEIEASRHQKFDYETTWNLHRKCDCEPFAFVEPLYKERKRLQALNDDSTGQNMGIALKLILNSLYGKMAQSIGKPKYANPIYASLITSITRAKLYNMIHRISDCENNPTAPCGIDTFYLATDGILSLRKLADNTDIGDQLGQWDYSYSPEKLLMIQTGLYIGEAKTRTRGIPAALLAAHAEKFWKEWEQFYLMNAVMKTAQVLPGQVEIPFNQFCGLVQGVSVGQLHNVGSWMTIPRIFGFVLFNKRGYDTVEWMDQNLYVGPMAGDKRKASYAYTREIGQYRENNAAWYDKKVWMPYQPEEAGLFQFGEDQETATKELWATV